MDAPPVEDVRTRLLAWFDAGHRDLPWRRTRDPYRILVAEILLQRTRIVSGTPYYERFLARFPEVRTLASASEEDVLRAWEGLGFYRRARLLHAAAKAIVRDHGGSVPSDPAVLASLPGIGPYTAGAVASIAFGRPVPAVDGNVSRVLARLFRIEGDLARGRGRAHLGAIASSLVPADRPGAFNQALMELGATVCTPTAPSCDLCPLRDLCVARRAGVQESLPLLPLPRPPRLVAVVFGIVESRGRVLLVKRPPAGLLAGLWSLPGGEVPPSASAPEALAASLEEQTGVRAAVGGPWRPVAHTFSHRRWTGTIYLCQPRSAGPAADGARWVPFDHLASLPIVPFHRAALEALAASRRRGTT